MEPSLQRWIAAHPYLTDLARFQEIVAVAIASVPPPRLGSARLAAYAPDHAAGVALLHSAAAGVDLRPAAAALVEVAARLAASPAPDKVRGEAAALHRHLAASPAARDEALAFLLGAAGPGAAAPFAGVLRFLGWRTLRAALAPVLREYAAWREDVAAAGEDRWVRGECPTCGAAPGLAQLVPEGEARRRRLACGCCGTTWAFRRLGCPFCGNDARDHLGVLEVEGEARVQLEICDRCSGYLKTYAGIGEEEVFLADWTTLHLDVLAREQGLKRVGASLYDL